MRLLLNMKIFFAIILITTTTQLMGTHPHGTTLARAKNVHSGNKVRTTFYNFGLVGRQMDEPEDIGGEWPINSTHEYIGDVGIMVGSEIIDENGNLKHSVVTIFSPRGSEMNLDEHWGWEPLMGYFNDDTNLVAMSHMGPPSDPSNPTVPNTWPDQWPDKLTDELDPGWPGSWNGYFGKDQKNAEQESYFVMDDANDAEFLFFPDTTDFERRGLGLNAIIRGLQWNHIMAEDVIFWLYDIKNIGHKLNNKMVFGAIVGTTTGGGGDTNDDYADFDKVDDIAYSYDHGTDLETGLGGIGSGGWSPVGLAGYAFLESPGNAVDGIDNDGDGSNGGGMILTKTMLDDWTYNGISYSPGDSIIIIDYKTFSRTHSVFPMDTLRIQHNSGFITITVDSAYNGLKEIPRNLIDDNLNGLIDENNGELVEIIEGSGVYEHFYLNEELLAVNYFTGDGLDNLLLDESRSDGIDNDGDWNPETDDVGRDGAPGSGDTFYGEGDGEATSGYELIGEEWVDTGLPGEPNIDKTDIDESDQIGLSSFFYFAFGVFSDMGCDPCLWDKMYPGYFNKSVQNVDADFLFGSGYFPLQAGEIERFSLGLLFGDNLPDLVRNKQTVQTIYNQNYNFAKAPELPTVWAYASDGYVTLYWDGIAEDSYDRLSGYDFEGYKIYKATDTQFTDAGEITDAYGSPKFNVAVKQFDLDNEHSGFFEIDIDGVKFDLGENTGLVHTWTDTNVINGHRYFYAVTAYDHGNLEKDILPAETSKFVTIDKGGNVQTATNVVSVVPDAPAAGYVIPPQEAGEDDVYPIHPPKGTGFISLNNIDPSKILSGHVYQIYFKDSRSNGIDDDGDWVPWEDIYGNGVWDSTETFYDYGLDGLPDTDDEGEENGEIDWLDYGIDGLRSQDEPGYNPWGNPDPNHDNYGDWNCSDGYDNDGDGLIDDEDLNEDGGCDDWGTENDEIYQSEETGEPFLDVNGIFDPQDKLKNDVGQDGCRDEFEDGVGGCYEVENPDYVEGSDPNNDNYDPIDNPSGTEGNLSPDLGEPNLDSLDVEEMIPVTSHFTVVDVTDLNNHKTVIPWTSDIDDDKAIFQGMQIIIDNDWDIKASVLLSPELDEGYSVEFTKFNRPSEFSTTGFKYPKDVQIIFADTLIGQSISVDLIKTDGDTLKAESILTNFLIMDPYDQSEIAFAIFDQTWPYSIPDSVFNPSNYSQYTIIDTTVEEGDTSFVITISDSGHFSYGDEILLLEDLADTTVITWNITASTTDISIFTLPGHGDSLNIIVTKPFNSDDIFEFVSNAPYVDPQKMKKDIRQVKVVPNPYIAGASWEGQNPYATGRGPRSIHFNHLPPQCEIRIYTLTGELVDIIKHSTDLDDGSAEWDMLTKDNLAIAYGIYLYHIEPLPGSNYDFKPILGKFAVIK